MLTYPEYQIRDGLLFKNRKLLISSSSHLRNSIIQEFHSTAIAEHGGIQKIDKTASNSYWPGWKADVENFVKSCQVCQQSKI